MKRLLFIAHKVPYPPDKGERLRAFHEIRALAGHFRITLAALAHSRADREAAGAMRQWCEKVLVAGAGGRLGLIHGAAALLTGKSATEGFFRSRRLRRLLAAEATREPFDLVMACCSSMLPYAAGVPAPARVMDLVDVDSAKWLSYAASARGPKRWLYRTEARRVARLERRAVHTCRAVLLVSEDEVRALQADSPPGVVMALPNGVDMDYFSPARVPQPVLPGRAAPSVAFTGTMDYRPNVEAVCWFVREVWPQLRRRAPELTFLVVGRDPVRRVRRLAASPGVTVTGSVPDVRPYLAAATVVVAPLHIARGIQNKVLEAMAMGRAVVASSAALEGIEASCGQEVLRADSPEQWTRQIRLLLAEPEQRRRIELAARRAVEDRYSWPARMAPLVSLCLRLAGSPDPAGAAGSLPAP